MTFQLAGHRSPDLFVCKYCSSKVDSSAQAVVSKQSYERLRPVKNLRPIILLAIHLWDAD